MRSVRVFLLGLGCAVSSFAQAPPTAAPVPRFEDVTKKAGLTASHLSSPEKRYLIESTSGGIGFIDCNNSGKLDIIMVNGSSVDRYKQGGDPMITLYHQNGDLHFTDITQTAGLTHRGWGMSVTVMDYDNDGWLDIFVTGYGGNALYHNLGKCKFQDVTEKAGLDFVGFNSGAAWSDFDRDGFVDVFFPGYTYMDIKKLPEFGSNDKFCRYKGVMVQCGPGGLPGEPDHLFHNRGDGTFEDVSKKAGVDDPNHSYGLQGVWADYDNDGWPDLYVSNDGQANYLYHNKHDGTFDEVGLMSGAALSLDGRAEGSMGVDFADIDHDGQLDIIVTNFIDEPNALYWNQGDKGFTDIAWSSGIAQDSVPMSGWGTGFFDMDNDGWDDLFIVNGHVYPQMDFIKGGAGYKQPMFLYRNNRNRTFENVSALSGLDQFPKASRRGVAFGDVNNDGKVDILMLTLGEPPTLLINRTETTNHAALFKLIGTKSNKAAIGARVTVTCGDLTQFKEVRSGSSYMSQNDLRLHFGLAQNSVMNKVEVSWPSGQKDVYQNLPADVIYTLTEGGSVPQKVPFSK